MQSRNKRIIRTDLLRENMRSIRRTVDPKVKVLAVVKADGYGHGGPEAARAALEGGADFLAVASVSEGSLLRRAGITAPVLVLGPVTSSDVAEGVGNRLIQTVCSPEMVMMCEDAAAFLNCAAEVHLKIDTGMGRIGVRNETEMKAVADAISRSGHVRLTGSFTHFADADGDEDGERFTERQYRRFLELTHSLPEGIIRHCSNSAAIQRHPEYALDMVRAGISYYGYPPVDENRPEVRPCMRWTAKISYIKELPAGETVSYGRTFRTAAPIRVATVTCGYADGYHRCAGGKASVLIHGKRARVLGRICMDQMMADITEIPEAEVEDEVVLIGQDGEEEITAEDLARWSGTISYEILLSVGSRVERLYQHEEDR